MQNVLSCGLHVYAQSIPKFVESFKDQILMSDVALPISEFKTFNEFFYRYAPHATQQ